jgi:hypothetical protein
MIEVFDEATLVCVVYPLLVVSAFFVAYYIGKR